MRVRTTYPLNSVAPRLLAAALFLCGLCVSAHAENARDPNPESSSFGGTLVTSSIAEPTNLIPILATDSSSHEIVGKLFNGLLKYNPNIELEGDLARSWEVLDEGKTLIFHLKTNVLWHDLKPLTAHDVEFTYQKLVDPDMPSPYGGDFEKVKEFLVLDDYTVKVTYEKPFSPSLASWTMWVMPKHLLEHEDFLSTDFARHPVGSGPYKFKRWISGDRVELVRFSQYFEGPAKLDRVVTRVIPDQTTSFLELHQETVDLTSLTPLQYARQTDGPFFSEHFQKFKYPSFGYAYLGFNLTNDLFKDTRVRQAMNLAIDQQEIVDGILLGLGREATGPFSPDSWAYNPEVRPAGFDPEKAARLLAEAGWEDRDGDHVLEKDGSRFEFTIITNHGNFQRKQAAEMIQQRLAAVGIKVKIQVVEWSTFIKEFIDKRKFEAVLLAWGLSRDPDPHDIWHSSKTKLGEFNFLSYKNPEVDALIERGRGTFDRGERRAIYHQIHKIIYAEQPCIFLYVADALPIVHKRFRNVEATPIGIGYNFIDWEVSPEERKYKSFRL